jgi:hypothetical protein
VWQQVNFATPVAINANKTYVASYHTTTGNYIIDTNFFSTTAVDNSPLHTRASWASGGNGVFRYGANSVFPDQTFNAANYWVDVVFQAGAGASQAATAPTSTPSLRSASSTKSGEPPP